MGSNPTLSAIKSIIPEVVTACSEDFWFFILVERCSRRPNLVFCMNNLVKCQNIHLLGEVMIFKMVYSNGKYIKKKKLR